MKRILVVAICIVIQLVFYFIALVGFVEQYTLLRILLSIVSVVTVLEIVTVNKNLTNKVPWIVLIALFPVFGSLLYITLGHNLYKSKILRAIKKSIPKSQKYLKQDRDVLEEIKDKDKFIYGQVKYLADFAKYPIYRANEIKYFPLGEDAYKVILKELKKAEKFIFIEYFIISDGKMWNEILAILEEKVKKGVDVRVIYDDIGCATSLPDNYDKILEEKGIKCIDFNKLKLVLSVILNNRDHRKILDIDGRVAFSGGINIADEYINEKERFGHWKDNAIMVKGEAVWNFTNIFLEIWNAYREEKNKYTEYKYDFSKEPLKTDGFICPYGENPLDNENVGENVYMNILNQATKYCYIFTPYLIIGSEMISALSLAAKRGVDVRIIVPGIPDKKIVYATTKSYYYMLLEQGVKIYEYTPGFLHSKVFVCDDNVATVGTLNLDYRSLYLHFECGAYIYEANVIKDIKKDVIDTIKQSKEVKFEDIKKTKPSLLKSGILRLIAPLL